MLEGKKVILAITGSIAAYKAIVLLRLLKRAGASVKVILTPSARDFVSPLVLSTLSGSEVLCDFSQKDNWSDHVDMGLWADVMVVAPLSCNTLSKMANGICDNFLMAVYLSIGCPVVVAPAMDENMWRHPATKNNIEKIKSFGNLVMPVGVGELGSGLRGPGRMAEPETIFHYLEETIFRKTELSGLKVLVTAGPTYESIDPVRFIGNFSSGKMGFAIAEAFYLRGASVKLIAGPTHLSLPYFGISRIDVHDSESMYKSCMENFKDFDIIVMSAAVADYRPETVADQKIAKSENQMTLVLEKSHDILSEMGKEKSPLQYMAGFALETNDGESHARAKLARKHADCIILNSLTDVGAGFENDTNKVTIFTPKGEPRFLALKSKRDIAEDIVTFIAEDRIVKLQDPQQSEKSN